jgi:UPF0176 protein
MRQMQRIEISPVTITIAALYQFAPFDDPSSLQEPLLALCRAKAIRGTILLAGEGINGTIAGEEGDVAAVLAHIRTLPGCAALDVKYSYASSPPFLRMKVRIKREIVTLGVPGIDPARNAGRHVDAADWNALISDPEVIVIDTRNDYEVGIGSFAGAINPGTTSFSDFPAWFQAMRSQLPDNPRVAMFCTGGIRCEKSTAYLRAQGIEDVSHLKGGILKYLETVPAEDSLWQGECFVFDQRVSVGQGLAPGGHDLCHACRMPLSVADRTSPDYVEGISCPHCMAARDDGQRRRYAERQRQVTRAEQRGVAHLGDDAGG